MSDDQSKPPQPIQTESIVTVQAYHCIAFAFATGSNLTGPEGEGLVPPDIRSFDEYRPLVFNVDPSSFSAISVRVTGPTADPQWQHDKTNDDTRSGPNGRTNSPSHHQAMNDEYISSVYGSEDIENEKIYCNCLIGMFDVKDPNSGKFEVIEIGSGKPNINIPSRASRFYLACHDAYEWNNNSGHMVVEVLEIP